VNLAAVAAVALGVGLYYAVPDSTVKVVWGVAVGAAAYLAVRRAATAAGLGEAANAAAPAPASDAVGRR
jgi:hypothetical protein